MGLDVDVRRRGGRGTARRLASGDEMIGISARSRADVARVSSICGCRAASEQCGSKVNRPLPVCQVHGVREGGVSEKESHGPDLASLLHSQNETSIRLHLALARAFPSPCPLRRPIGIDGNDCL